MTRVRAQMITKVPKMITKVQGMMTYVYQGRIERRWRVRLGTEIEVKLWLCPDVEHQLKLDWRFGETYL